MATKNITLGTDGLMNMIFGQQDENDVTAIVFDFEDWKDEFGSGDLSLSVQRPKDQWPYDVELTVSGTTATWNVSETDTAYAGLGHFQVSYVVSGVVKKSIVYKFTVYESLGAVGDVLTPQQIRTFVDEVEEAIEGIEGTVEGLEEMIGDSLPVDTTLSVSGKAADAKKVGDEVSDLKEDLTRINTIIVMLDNGIAVFNSNLFEHGAYYTSSTSDQKCYVRSKSTISVNRDLTVTAKTGFKIKRLNSAKTADTGWIDSFTLDADTGYYICIRREPADTSEVANITEFVNSATFVSAIKYEMDLNKTSAETTMSDLQKTNGFIGNIISQLSDGKEVFNFNLFELGTYYTSSEPVYKYMVRSKNTISFNRSVVATAKTGFKVKCLNSAKTADTGWADSITLNANTEYYISIRREPTDTSEVANIAEFVSNVTFTTYDRGSIEDIKENLTDLSDKVQKEMISSNDHYYANGNMIRCYNPYKESGQLSLAGQLHCHTRELSTGLYYDGTDNAATTLAAYLAAGYDFLTITDYGDTVGGITEPDEEDIPEGLTWLFDSQEVRINSHSSASGTHMCTYNSKSAITTLYDKTVQEYIDEYKKDGVMVSLAHPFYSATAKTLDELDEIKTRLRFVEVFNGLSYAKDEDSSDPYVIPEGYDIDFAWQRLLDNGNAVWGIAVSDAHTISVTWRMELGCVFVFVNNNTRDEILKALCCGNFIACESINQPISQPTFINGVYSIDTDDDNATTVFMKEGGQVLKTVNGRNATYAMTGNEKYVRAIVTHGEQSGHRRRVWTQPVINISDSDYDAYDEFIKS